MNAPYINPDHVWDKSEIFIFASNLEGIHGAGSAGFARLRCGAELGFAEGRTGVAYAIPTCSRPGEPLPLRDIAEAVKRFIAHVLVETETKFFVTRIGCGIAGFTDAQIAPFFKPLWKEADNARLPPEWVALYEEMERASLPFDHH